MLDERDRYLVEAARFYPACSDREVARRLRAAWSRTRRAMETDRTENFCPPQHAGKLTAALWMLLKTATLPSERTIRAALAADRRPTSSSSYRGNELTDRPCLSTPIGEAGRVVSARQRGYSLPSVSVLVHRGDGGDIGGTHHRATTAPTITVNAPTPAISFGPARAVLRRDRPPAAASRRDG